MTLPSELLPAMQHYALFAAALALFSLSLTHVKRRFSVWVWLVVVVLPIAQIAWSLWETIEAVAAHGQRQPPAGGHAAWLIVAQALLHGLAIVVVLAVVLYVAVVSRSGDDLPRRVRIEPTVGGPGGEAKP